MKKVNLGCGSSSLPDWINIDSSFNVTLSRYPLLKKVLFRLHIISKTVYDSQFPSNIIRLDLTKGLPFESNSIDYIYSSHLLEHITRGDSLKLIAECHRVLKKEGICRIIVPDLKLIISNYTNDTISADQFIELLNFDIVGRKKTLAERIFPSFFAKDTHIQMFDFGSLKALLLSAGFKRVNKMSYREGLVPDIDFLDNRPDISLYLEAQK